MRTIIVDDEELARRGIHDLLVDAPDVEVVRECRNGREAIEAIHASEPDLMFLDIQMPGKTGFDVIEATRGGKCPHIIFVTAFDEFAVRAFEVHALDYLLKPINAARFSGALTRARVAIAQGQEERTGQRVADIVEELRRLLDHSQEVTSTDRIAVKTREGLQLVCVSDIDWVEADHDYVVLHTGQRNWLHREPISALETRLAPLGFVRINRSTMLNSNRVRTLQTLSRGEYTVVLNDGTELKLSRNYRTAFERLTGARL